MQIEEEREGKLLHPSSLFQALLPQILGFPNSNSQSKMSANAVPPLAGPPAAPPRRRRSPPPPHRWRTALQIPPPPTKPPEKGPSRSRASRRR
ncbi:putative CBS domain-containing protein CBSCBSPB3 [Iris pallida]|uniref:CBS domain-containing protein CBSCBSPB3 n=1 Tax=Iris pallida TaxID=29817 RepID=A0AAX6E2N5_IRIPA|nr:putative CBS domain-containing protein CBSCBSPB3 [Iris pallida]